MRHTALFTWLLLLGLSPGVFSFLFLARNTVKSPSTRHHAPSVASTSIPKGIALSTSAVFEADRFIGDKREVQRWRLIGLSTLALVFINQEFIDTTIAAIWDRLRSNHIFQHDMFEPAVAVTSFFVWVHLWYYAEMAGVKGQFPWLMKHKLSNIQNTTMHANTSSKLQNDNRLSNWYSNWWKFELPVYLLPLLALSVFFDAFACRRLALKQAAPTVWRIGREILGGLFFYDLFFWFTHMPLHRLSPWLYKHLHAKHHTTPEVRASDVVRLTAVEELIDVACSIAGLRILNAHPISRSIYNIIITGLLTELHCGYDVPMSFQNLVPFGIWGGSRRHHIHHRTGKAYFQKFFTYLDNIFGFIDEKCTNIAHSTVEHT